jgi:hypothetical protein
MCRPIAFLLTGGNVADCKAGEVLIDRMPATSLLNADKGYDSDAIRRQVRQRGAFANIPPKANRTWKKLLLAAPLPGPQRHRAHVLQAQGLPPHCNPIRSTGYKLPRSGLHRSNRQLLVMSPDPRTGEVLSAP